MKKSKLVLAAGIAALVFLVAGGVALAVSGDDPVKLKYQQFLERVESDQVAKAKINTLTGAVEGTMTSAKSEKRSPFTAVVPPDAIDQISRQLARNDATVEIVTNESTLVEDLITTLLPTLLIIGVFIWFMVQTQGANGKGGKFSRVKTKGASEAGAVTFADVAGADEAVEELREITEFLKNPDRFLAMGAKIPKGVLLFGPPGTGKTLLAKAVAGEAGAPFLSLSGSDFVEMFVGVGASRVRDLFRQAKEQAPAIIFVDEIDAVGRHRGAGVGGGHDEREQTLNQLLVEMDGFDAASGVILMAATNRPDILDPALLRPGRFDRQVMVDPPDRAGREQILSVHSRNKPMADEVDLSVIAGRTPGFSGADLANIVNEAAILAARRASTVIEDVDLTEAIDRIVAGPQKKNRLMSDAERQVIAVHEAGHAVVGHFVEGTDPVHRVSIVSRGRALGWTLSLPTEDRYLQTAGELRGRMAMMLGGRTAEEIVVGEVTTGAADDIERVSDIARKMVTEFGMSSSLGLRKFGHNDGEPFLGRETSHQADYSPEVAALVDAEIARLIDEAHALARETIEAHRVELDALCALLIERESVDEDDLLRIFAQG